MQHNEFSGIPQPKPKLGIGDTDEVICESCKHNVFNLGLLLRKVSPILSGTGKAEYIPIQNIAFYCVKCGHVNKEFIPDELKSKGSIIS